MATTRIAARGVREDQVYTSHPVTKKEGQVSRARLGLEVFVVPTGRSQYLYSGGVSRVDFTCNPIPPN